MDVRSSKKIGGARLPFAAALESATMGSLEAAARLCSRRGDITSAEAAALAGPYEFSEGDVEVQEVGLLAPLDGCCC